MAKKAGVDNGAIDRIPSGIPGLDKLIGGGLVKNSTVMVRGDTGTAKTLLCMQYLQSGAAEHDEPGVFISFSETNEMLCQHGKGFGWDCATLQKRGKLTLAKYTPHEVVEIIESGGGLIRDTIDSAGAKRLVIDSLSAYEMLFENRYKANQSVLGLFDLLRKWNVTTLVTSEFPVSLMKQTKERLGFLTDGIINLYHFRRDGKCVRALEVVKMRDTAHNEDINLFEIGKGGLRVLRGLGGLGR